MKTIIYLFFVLVIFNQNAWAQPADKPDKGHVYFSFGWHRIYYTNSTIHFSDNNTGNYDFRLLKAKAIDDNDLKVGRQYEAPQYSVRLGFLFKNKKTGIEINFDHIKYILKQGQRVSLEGTINGDKLNRDTVLAPSFIDYEHTDGGNYWMVNLVKQKKLAESKNGKHELHLLIKPGAGLVIPRSDTKIMGKARNDKYHVSGYVLGAESGLRATFFKHLIAEFTCKGAFAKYTDVLLYGSGRAQQQWWSFQYIMLIGYQLDLTKK